MMGQYQPGQALVMENGQIILTQGAPLVSVDSTQSQTSQASVSDFIQILTSDGQVQQFALAKNKIQPQTMTQPFSFLPTQTTGPTLAPRIVSSTGPAILQGMGDIHTVGTSMMTLAPAPLIYNTSSPTTPIQPQQVYQAPDNQENPGAVSKIVSDWDSDEDN